MKTGPTMYEWHGAHWRLGLVFPRFWHPSVRMRLRPFWLYLAILHVWRLP